MFNLNIVATNSWEYTATQTEVAQPSYEFGEDEDDDARSHHTAGAMTPQNTDIGMNTPAPSYYGGDNAGGIINNKIQIQNKKYILHQSKQTQQNIYFINKKQFNHSTT